MVRRRKEKESDAQWMRRVFPDARARDVADLAIESLDVAAPMSEYLDAWVAAYRAAGGRTSIVG